MKLFGGQVWLQCPLLIELHDESAAERMILTSARTPHGDTNRSCR